MPYRDPGGRSRWQRLAPRDGPDIGWLAFALLGVLLGLGAAVGLSGAEFGPLAVLVGPILALHGSTPAFFFVGLTVFLMRGGRCIGRERRWVWAGLLLTVPLWFLIGQPIAVRGLGDLTALVVPWNLLAFGLMATGVWRTLHTR